MEGNAIGNPKRGEKRDHEETEACGLDWIGLDGDRVQQCGKMAAGDKTDGGQGDGKNEDWSVVVVFSCRGRVSMLWMVEANSSNDQ